MDEIPEIPGYTLTRLLGKGGMGAVFLARHLALGREAAIKVMSARNADERSKLRFLREAKVMTRLNHRNLIQLLDFGELPDGDLWLALECIHGDSLDQVLAARGPLAPAEAREIMVQVARGLAHMHEAGILHRDIKPANIMLEEGGRAVLMDLGLAWAEDVTVLTRTGRLLGTPHYIAPEVLVRGSFDEKADWYTWAYTWWELLAGERPITFPTLMAELAEKRLPVLPAPYSPHGTLDRAEVEVILRAGGKHPVRLANLGEIEALLAGEEPPARPAGEEDERPTEELAPVLVSSASLPTMDLAAPAGPATPGDPGPARGFPAARVGAALAGALALAVVGYRAVTPDLPPGAPASAIPALEILARHRGVASVVLEGRAVDAAAVRAARILEGRKVPYPVYATGPRAFLVWLPGLLPGEPVEVEIEEAGQPSLREFVRVAGEGEEPAKVFPEPLRRYRSRRGDAVDEEVLADLRAVVDAPERLDSQRPFGRELQRIADLPYSAWPRILAWMEEGGLVSLNLALLFGWASPEIPPEIAWFLLHRHADFRSPYNQRFQKWQIDFPVVGVHRLPDLAYARLDEWGRRDPGSLRAHFRLLARLSKVLTGGTGWTEFPHPIPGWGVGGGEARTPPAPPGSLLELVGMARAASGEAETPAAQLLDRSRREGLDAWWATALLPALRDRALVPELVARFAFEEGNALLAVDAAIEALKTEHGFFTFADEGLLYRKIFHGEAYVRAEAAEGLTVTYRPELNIMVGFFEAPGARVRVVREDGTARAFEVTTEDGFKELAAP